MLVNKNSDRNNLNLSQSVILASNNTDYHLKYYPVSLNVAEKNCLVVGGGTVGARKAVTLAKCKARVNVVSPVFSDEFIKETAHNYTKIYNNSIHCIKKHYDISDLESMFLVIGATDNMTVNRQIAMDAQKRQVLCNIADFPEGSSFILPSIVHRGDLVLTVSTSGKSPALAKKLRKELELQFGKEYATFLILMGDIRRVLLDSHHLENHLEKHSENHLKNHLQENSENSLQETHASIFRELVNSDLLEKIASSDSAGIEHTIQQILGKHLNIKESNIIWKIL